MDMGRKKDFRLAYFEGIPFVYSDWVILPQDFFDTWQSDMLEAIDFEQQQLAFDSIPDDEIMESVMLTERQNPVLDI